MQFREMRLITVIQLLLLMLNKRVNGRGLRPNMSGLESSKSNSEGECERLQQCKYICYNGNHSTIERNVNAVDDKDCIFISELHLLNYKFPRKILPKRLLGSISDRVNFLAIYSSDIQYIDAGAFESKTLAGVHLENLKLKHIDKGVFRNVNEHFTSFTLIQSHPVLSSVNESLLEYIKYQIKNLTIQTGLMKVENLTGSQCLLNNLDNIDLSYNNFGGALTPESFSQLSVVQKLNLTHSEITFLPESVFDHMVLTLRILDLSSNKLTVIGRNIFGWRSISSALTLHLYGNPWICTCDLKEEMNVILASQVDKVYCGNMQHVLVTSETICPIATSTTELSDFSSNNYMSSAQESLNFKVSSKEAIQTTDLIPTASQFDAYATTHDVECHTDDGKLETEHLSIYWPNTLFDIVKKKISEVDIVVRKNSNESYGVLWFSKVTLQYYKMEMNHNDYGLGCYGRVERITTINHLLPDMAYTFCLILKDHLTVSPFSCKSVYIDGHLDIKYNAWLTTNMKATGISVMIIGSVLFMILGIFFTFVLLKHKPSLLKGSKRVAMQKNDASNILIFPEDKTLQKFKLMEQQLANNKLGGLPFQRLSSVSANSLDSIQSYMNPENANIYEIIPAHQSVSSARYAEVPFKRKRSSNDPLPEIPHIAEESRSTHFGRNLEVPSEQYYETGASVYI